MLRNPIEDMALEGAASSAAHRIEVRYVWLRARACVCLCLCVHACGRSHMPVGRRAAHGGCCAAAIPVAPRAFAQQCVAAREAGPSHCVPLASVRVPARRAVCRPTDFGQPHFDLFPRLPPQHHGRTIMVRALKPAPHCAAPHRTTGVRMRAVACVYVCVRVCVRAHAPACACVRVHVRASATPALRQPSDLRADRISAGLLSLAFSRPSCRRLGACRRGRAVAGRCGTSATRSARG
jgi:hypothetical protein